MLPCWPWPRAPGAAAAAAPAPSAALEMDPAAANAGFALAGWFGATSLAALVLLWSFAAAGAPYGGGSVSPTYTHARPGTGTRSGQTGAGWGRGGSVCTEDSGPHPSPLAPVCQCHISTCTCRAQAAAGACMCMHAMLCCMRKRCSRRSIALKAYTYMALSALPTHVRRATGAAVAASGLAPFPGRSPIVLVVVVLAQTMPMPVGRREPAGRHARSGTHRPA